jgi:hypothetical protein
MNSILSEIWRGAYFPLEKRLISKEERSELMANVQTAREAVEKELEKTALPKLEKYDNTLDMLSARFEEEAFIKGVHLGLRLMCGVLSDS